MLLQNLGYFSCGNCKRRSQKYEDFVSAFFITRSLCIMLIRNIVRKDFIMNSGVIGEKERIFLLGSLVIWCGYPLLLNVLSKYLFNFLKGWTLILIIIYLNRGSIESLHIAEIVNIFYRWPLMPFVIWSRWPLIFKCIFNSENIWMKNVTMSEVCLPINGKENVSVNGRFF